VQVAVGWQGDPYQQEERRGELLMPRGLAANGSKLALLLSNLLSLRHVAMMHHRTQSVSTDVTIPVCIALCSCDSSKLFSTISSERMSSYYE
jgi:hypothetical protein